MPADRPALRPLARVLAAAAAANFCFACGESLFNLLPLHILAQGGTDAQVGLIMGLANVAAMLTPPLWGIGLDRWGRRLFLYVGAGLMALSSLGFALAPGAVGFFPLLRFVHGAASSAWWTAVSALVADLAPPERRGQVLGLVGVSGMLSMAIAPAVGEWVARGYGFRALFVGAVALATVAALLTRVITDVPGSRAPGASGNPVLAILALPRRVYPAFLVNGLFGFAQATLFVFLPAYAHHVRIPRIGPFYLAYSCIAVGVRLFGGWIIDQASKRWILVPSLGAMALGLLILPSTDAAGTLVLVGLISGCGHGFLYPATSTMVIERAGAGQAGVALGAYTSLGRVGATLSAFGFGWLLAGGFGYTTVFLTATGVTLAGTALFFLMEQRR
jgi:MFS family permease